MTSTSPPFTSTLEQRVQGYIRARVPLQEAEDVIQDAWLKIIQNKEKFDANRGSLWSWAIFQCKSAIAQHYRRRQPTQSLETNEPPVPLEQSPAHYERLLEATFAAPKDLHHLIAFGYIQLLAWKPAEVVAELAGEALEDLGNRFVVEYSSHFPHHRNTILNLLRPFTERLRGERTTLGNFFSQGNDKKQRAAEAGRWRSSVLRRVRSDYLFLESLEALLASSHPRHRQIVHGLLVILHWKPQTLAKNHSHKSLETLALAFEAGCCSPRRKHLKYLIYKIFRPLLRDPSLQGKTLQDFLSPSQDPAEEFVLWCIRSERRKP